MMLISAKVQPRPAPPEMLVNVSISMLIKVHIENGNEATDGA
jgi:hypothetical protein